MTQNQKLQAVVSIRNLVVGLDTEWKELKNLGSEIDTLIEKADDIFLNNTKVGIHTSWIREINVVKKEVASLKELLNNSIAKINNKDSTGIADAWSAYEKHYNSIFEALQTQSELGRAHLNKQKYATEWEDLWNRVFSKMIAIQQIAEGSALRLAMIEEFSPGEMDELTDTILNNMPKKYTMEEALQYEKEYMEAYDELKKQSSQKKNLWDRFLDLLAGGKSQSPAEMVMMQRWINGEKIN